MTADDLKALIRTVPDFPKQGIMFRDITTLLADGKGLTAAVELIAGRANAVGCGAIAGLEARGFIFGAAVASLLMLGFVPVRKAGKLPVATIGIDYALEYGHARLEIDPTLIRPGERVIIVDDLIATGGTALAAAQLLRQAGAVVDRALFVIDLPDLGGTKLLEANGIAVESLMAFEGD
ncbi:MAG: adenine phosphoribosyltransferase [Novosphingobium sp.]|nr:adenine phosphoribosyltransferase [Novosphingobium sp.]MBO9603390.1 adenine phosphoribosyltransferase [Novosphingobium sp.]